MKPEAVRPFILAIESVLFTIIVPGTVTIWLPWAILLNGTPLLPATWGLLHYAALPLVGLGLTVYFRCLWDFAVSGGGIPVPVDHPKRLVVRGLYRYVRNPMYLGVLCVLLGEVTFLQSRALLVYATAWFLIVQGVIVLYEEPGLRARFGAEYERYARSVRRWLPGPPYDGGTGRPHDGGRRVGRI